MELTLKEHCTDTSITHEALFIHHESASHWKAWEFKKNPMRLLRFIKGLHEKTLQDVGI